MSSPTYTPPALTAFTAEIWVNLNGTTPPGTMEVFASGDTNDGFNIQVNPATLAPTVKLGNGSAYTTFSLGAELPSTGWTYLAVTWDGSTVTTYQNGATATQGAWSGPFGTDANPVTIGSNLAGAANWFSGLLSEAVIYSTALDYTRILAHYNAQNQGITGSNIAAGTVVAGIVDGTIIEGAEFIAGVAGGSQLTLTGSSGTAFNVTSDIGGAFNAIASLTTQDTNEVFGGILASALFGAGTAAKMSTVLTSPFGTEGMAVVLSSQNDARSDTAWAMLGTVTTPDDTTINFSPAMFIAPGVMLVYGAGSTLSVVTKTSGSGTIPVPAGVTTAKGECWGCGGSLSGTSGGRSAECGCGGGEYAAELTWTVTASGTVAYSVPTSGSGSNATLNNGLGTVITAHPGQPGTTSHYGDGGTGSANSVHHDGGRGGGASAQYPGGGGGGGAAGSSSGTGDHGNQASPSEGGAGGTGVSGAGSGGAGGSPTGNGKVGSSPGGGGGGGSTNADGAIGGHGQVRVTFLSGVPTVMWSVSNAAGTDPFGNAYGSGAWQALTLINGWSGTCYYRMWGGNVQLQVNIDSTSATDFQFGTMPTGYRPNYTAYLAAGANANVGSGVSPFVQITSAGTISMNGLHAFSTAGVWICGGSYPLSV